MRGGPAELLTATSEGWEQMGAIELSRLGSAKVPVGSTFRADPSSVGGDGTGTLVVEGVLDARGSTNLTAVINVDVAESGLVHCAQTVRLHHTLSVYGNVSGIHELRTSGIASNDASSVAASSPSLVLGRTAGTLAVTELVHLEPNSSVYVEAVERTAPAIETKAFVLDQGAVVDGIGRARVAQADGSGKHYNSGEYSQQSKNSGSGAGHGGAGANSKYFVGGLAYGDALFPKLPGSTGGNGHYALGGFGGSSFWVNASSIIVDGIIRMDGGFPQQLAENRVHGSRPLMKNAPQAPFDEGAGGGSGGSILLESDTVSGSGRLTVDGGNGQTNYYGTDDFEYVHGGGGSAGRIAVWSRAANLFEGSYSAAGGISGNGKSAGGAAGTVYVNNKGVSVLHVANNGMRGGPAELLSATSVPTNTLFNLSKSGGISTSLSSISEAQLIGDGTGTFISSGSLDATELSIIESVHIALRPASSTFFARHLEVRSSLVIEGAVHGLVDLTVSRGGSAAWTETAFSNIAAVFELASLVVEEGAFGKITSNEMVTFLVEEAVINGTLKACTASARAPATGVQCGVSGGSNAGGSGGGHGGVGGFGGVSIARGDAFGDSSRPSLVGCYGGDGTSNKIGGRGGGALRLVAHKSLIVIGQLVAAGQLPEMSSGPMVLGHPTVPVPASANEYWPAAGSGAGGSIWVEAPTIEGLGSLVACGANGQSVSRYPDGARDGGSGGGGRIVVTTQRPLKRRSIRFDVAGGTSRFERNSGSNGTVAVITNATLTGCPRLYKCLNGECLSTGACSCSDGWYGARCHFHAAPSVATVSPASAFGDVGGWIEVNGTSFANSTQLRCKFGPLSVRGKYEGKSKIRCRAPPWTGFDSWDYNVGFQLSIDGYHFSSAVGFLYKSRPSTRSPTAMMSQTDSPTAAIEPTAAPTLKPSQSPTISFADDECRILGPTTSIVHAVEGVPYCVALPNMSSRSTAVGYNILEAPAGATINHTARATASATTEGANRTGCLCLERPTVGEYEVTVQITCNRGNAFRTWRLITAPSYDVQGGLAGPGEAFANDALVSFVGRAASVLDQSIPQAFVPVKLTICFRKYNSTFLPVTDENGRFNFTYTAGVAAAGRFRYFLSHPDNNEFVSGQFSIFKLNIDAEKILDIPVVVGEHARRLMTLYNPGDTYTTLTGVHVAAAISSSCAQLSASVLGANHDGLTIRGMQRLRLLQLDVDASRCRNALSTDSIGTATVSVESSEGASVLLNVTLRVRNDEQALASLPSSAEITVTAGSVARTTIRIRSTGIRKIPRVSVHLDKADLAHKDLRFSFTTPSAMPVMMPNDEMVLQVQAYDRTPKTGLLASTERVNTSGLVQLSVFSEDIHLLNIPLAWKVCSDSRRWLVIRTVDERYYYSGIESDSDGSRPVLSGAHVRVTHRNRRSHEYECQTGVDGECAILVDREGDYEIIANAEGHMPYRSLHTVTHDPTVVTLLCLSRGVTFIWSVASDQSYKDRYVFTIEADFLTYVPPPVLTLEPLITSLDGLACGTSRSITYELTNHGLITAQDVELALPSMRGFHFETLSSYLGDINARTTLTFPVLVTADDCKQQQRRLGCGWGFAGGGFMDGSEGDGGGSLNAIGSFSCGGSAHNVGAAAGFRGGGQGRASGRRRRLCSVGGGGRGGGGGSSGSWGGGGCSIVPWAGGGGGGGNGGGGGGGNGGGGDDKDEDKPPWEPDGCDLGPGLDCVVNVIKLTKTVVGWNWKCALVATPAAPLGALLCAYTIYSDIKDVYDTVESCTTYYECKSKSRRLLLEGSSSGGGGHRRLTRELAEIKEALSSANELFGVIHALLPDPVLRLSSDLPIGERAKLLRLYDVMQYHGLDADFWSQVEAIGLDADVRAAVAKLTSKHGDAGTANSTLSDEYLRQLYSSLGALSNATQRAQRSGYSDVISAIASGAKRYIALRDPPIGVCAVVRVRIEQELMMTRQVVHARLELANSGEGSLAKINATLRVYQLDLSATSEAQAVTVAADAFVIRQVAMANTTVVAGGSCKIAWRLMPTDGAAVTRPQDYFIGGELTYWNGVKRVQQSLKASKVTVVPAPRLAVRYFWQRQVYSDDPFTKDVVEPMTPFVIGRRCAYCLHSLCRPLINCSPLHTIYTGTLIKNNGNGPARNLEIRSGQPHIIDNEKGLLVDFQIIGARVNERRAAPVLKVELGDVPPRSCADVQWYLVASLQGVFSNFSASYVHTGANGEPADTFSVIESLDISELIQVVNAHGPTSTAAISNSSSSIDDGNDNSQLMPTARDFLTNDEPDPDHLPDTVWSSVDASRAPVAVWLDKIPSKRLSCADIGLAACARLEVDNAKDSVAGQRVTATLRLLPRQYGRYNDSRFGMAHPCVRCVEMEFLYARVVDPLGLEYEVETAELLHTKQVIEASNVWRTFSTVRLASGTYKENYLHLFMRYIPNVSALVVTYTKLPTVTGIRIANVTATTCVVSWEPPNAPARGTKRQRRYRVLVDSPHLEYVTTSPWVRIAGLWANTEAKVEVFVGSIGHFSSHGASALIATPPCAPSLGCSNGGAQLKDCSCQCVGLWGGERCSECAHGAYEGGEQSNRHDCSNGVFNRSSCRCQCEPNWSGTSCDVEVGAAVCFTGSRGRVCSSHTPKANPADGLQPRLVRRVQLETPSTANFHLMFPEGSGSSVGISGDGGSASHFVDPSAPQGSPSGWKWSGDTFIITANEERVDFTMRIELKERPASSGEAIYCFIHV
jgi:hypothetical protein